MMRPDSDADVLLLIVEILGEVVSVDPGYVGVQRAVPLAERAHSEIARLRTESAALKAPQPKMPR